MATLTLNERLEDIKIELSFLERGFNQNENDFNSDKISKINQGLAEIKTDLFAHSDEHLSKKEQLIIDVKQLLNY